MTIISKNITKNYFTIVLTIGITISFLGGYFTGIEVERDKVIKEETTVQKEIKKINQRMDVLEKSNSETIIQIERDNDPILGSPEAPISIIEFSDYQCPFCARFFSETLPLLKSEYIEKGAVNFIYRDFPIQNIHPNAVAAAIASECANEQGDFWQYHDMLFRNQKEWNNLDSERALKTFGQYAYEIGIKQEQFDNCLNSGKYIEEVKEDLSSGREYGVTGTPGFFIGNDKIGYTSLSGAKPFSEFKAIIDEKTYLLNE